MSNLTYQTNQTTIHWLLIQSGCKQSWVGYGWITTWTCVTWVISTLRPFVPRTSGGSGAVLKSWNCMKFRVFFSDEKNQILEKKGDFKKRKNFTLWLYAYLQGFPHCDLRSGLLHWTSTLQRAAGCGMRNASGRKSMRCRVPNRNACAISLEAMHVCFHGFTWCLWRNASWTSWCLIWCYMMFSWFQLVHSQSKSMPSMQPKEKYQVPDVTTFNLPGSGGGSGKSPGELRTSKLLRFALHWNHWWKTKIVPLRHLSRPFPTFRSRKNRRVIPG